MLFSRQGSTLSLVDFPIIFLLSQGGAFTLVLIFTLVKLLLQNTVSKVFSYNRYHSQIWCGVWVFISAALMLMSNLNHFFIFALTGNLTMIVVFGLGPEYERWPSKLERVVLTDHLFLGVLYLLLFAERFVLEVWRIEKGRWTMTFDSDMLYHLMTFPLAGFALFIGAET